MNGKEIEGNGRACGKSLRSGDGEDGREVTEQALGRSRGRAQVKEGTRAEVLRWGRAWWVQSTVRRWV